MSHAGSEAGPLQLAPGEFFGGTRLARSGGSHLSHVFLRYFGLSPGQYRALAGCMGGMARRFQIDETHAAL